MALENLFKDMEKVTGKDKLKAIIQDKYKKYVKKSQRYFSTDELANLEALKNLTGIELGLPEEFIQETYKSYIEFSALYKLVYLKEIIGVDIKLPEEFIQKTYKKCIKKGEYDNLLMFRGISSADIKLPENFIQKTYRKLIKDKYVYGLKILLQVSGVEIKLPEEFLQKEYGIYLDLTHRYESLKELTVITGIKPSKELVQEKYKKFAKSGDISKLAWLYNTSQVEPSEEVLKILERSISKDSSKL